DGSLAGDHERGTCGALVEADPVEDELGAGQQLPAQRGERGTEAAAGPGAGKLAKRAQLLERREPCLELVDGVGVGAFLRAEDARGAACPEQRVADVAGDAKRRRAKRAAERVAHA